MTTRNPDLSWVPSLIRDLLDQSRRLAAIETRINAQQTVGPINKDMHDEQDK